MLKLESDAEPKYVEVYSLDAMQRCVFGSIQILSRKKDMVVYCNEEGMLKGLNYSAYIPEFLRHLGFRGYIPAMVYGNAVIAGKDKGLTKAQVEAVQEAYKVWYAEIHEEDYEEEEDKKKKGYEEAVVYPSPKKTKQDDVEDKELKERGE